jgi:hypothetical protein
MSSGDDDPAFAESGAGGREREADGAARQPGGREGDVCELCGGPTYERHCKIVCLTCGYVRDCSDP